MEGVYKIWKFPLQNAPMGGIDNIITDFPVVRPLAIKEQDGGTVMWAIVYTGANRVLEYKIRGILTGVGFDDIQDWKYIDTRTYGPDGEYVVHYFYQ